jgi:hypothetical protein
MGRRHEVWERCVPSRSPLGKSTSKVDVQAVVIHRGKLEGSKQGYDLVAKFGITHYSANDAGIL